jgi:hypothetical protein
MVGKLVDTHMIKSTTDRNQYNNMIVSGGLNSNSMRGGFYQSSNATGEKTAASVR